jgi:hypothetical protein
MHKVIQNSALPAGSYTCVLISSNGAITNTTVNDYCDLILTNYPF